MRIGISAVETGEAQALSKLTDQVRRAADDGFASVWLANIFGLEALTALAVAGSQVPGIELGTAVVPTYPRHPAVLAQQALTTALAVGPGRLALGIGLSAQDRHREHVRVQLRPARPHMREYLSVLLPLLDGHPVFLSGETPSGQDRAVDATDPGRVPCCSPRWRRGCSLWPGEHTDGTMLWMTGSPPSATTSFDDQGRGQRRRAAQPAGGVPPAGRVTSDPAAVRAAANEELAIYGQLPSYRAMLDKEGAAGPATSRSSETRTRSPRRSRRSRRPA